MTDLSTVRRLLVALACTFVLPTTATAGGPGISESTVKIAIRNNDSRFLEEALRDPALSGVTAEDGKTALMAACADDNLSLVESLLSGGVDVRARNARGGTALMYAAAGGSERIVRRLLDAGAEINHRAENGWTALTLASAKGHATSITVLLERGADPNIPDVFGFTPLMRAAQNRRGEAATALLESIRTDIVRVNTAGQSAMDVARDTGACDIAATLASAARARGLETGPGGDCVK